MGYPQLRRRLLQQTVSTGRLPAEYQEVEWIESHGAQYINTNTNNENFGFEVKFISYDELANTDYGAILGGRYSSNNNAVELNSYTSTDHPTWSGTLRLGGSSQNYDAHFNPKGQVNVIKYMNGVYTANGTDYSYAAGNINNTRYVYLFALRNNTSASSQGNIRMYYAKLYHSGVLARDFVPCYRKADSVIGMYDLENDVFYTNAGSGTFTKGGNV